MKEKRHFVEMGSGEQIALYHLKAADRVGLPILVTHGTISNISAVKGLGKYLSALGFDVWLLEWGGHGESKTAEKRQNFEYVAFNDVPTAIESVLTYTQREKLFWVSHSGGGLLLMMYLARHPEKQHQLAGWVSLGAQATDAALGLGKKASIAGLWGVTTMLGETPQAMVPMGTEGEPTMLLAQWATWNIRERWLGKDGFDYLAALPKVTIPTLAIAGGNDQIAPPSGCRKVLDALGSTDKRWLLCSEAAGFSKDFTHGQLVRGRAAVGEVFPKLGEWLRERNP